MTADPTASLDPAGRDSLRTVLELLAAERASVSSVIDPEQAWKVHIADSLSALEIAELSNADRIADIGSGAGFPGLPLAVALSGAKVDLIESVGRKCEFIRKAIAASGIANAEVLECRSEDLARSAGPEAYTAVTARAVGRLSTLAELASPLLAEGSALIAWKGKRDPDEEAQLERAAERLSMRSERILHVGPYAGSRHRHLHVIRKIGPTPADLPRRSGIAKKRPRG